MPDRRDLDAALRAVAADLDRRSRVATPIAARAGAAPSMGPRHPPLLVGMGVVAGFVAVLAGALVLIRDDQRREPVLIGPSSTIDEDVAPVDPMAFIGTPGGLAVLPANGDTLDILAFDELGGPLRRVGELPVTDDVRYASTGLLELSLGAGGAELAPASDPAELPEGCASVVGVGGVRIARCGGDVGLPDRLDRFDASGRTTPLVGMPPEKVAGHWRWLVPSPDGTTVLAQHSGECEVPSAWFVSPTDGAIAPVLPGQPDAEAVGLGWLPDGRAVVHVLTEGCGLPSEPPGVYAIDPAGARPIELLLPTPEPMSVWLVQSPGEPPVPLVRALRRGLREAGLAYELLPTDVVPDEGAVRATVDWQGRPIELIGAPVSGAFPYVPFGDTAVGGEPTELEGGFAASDGSADAGEFVAVSCGGAVWAAMVPGHLDGSGPAAEVLAAVVPHLYCTVGMAPLVSDEENLSPEKHAEAQDLADRLVAFALDPTASSLADLPFAETVMLGVGDQLVRVVNRAELIDPATWELDVDAFERDGPFSAVAILADHDGPTSAQLRPFGCGSEGRPPPEELLGYEDFFVQPTDVPFDTCINWFSVAVYQHPVTGELAGITVELGTP